MTTVFLQVKTDFFKKKISFFLSFFFIFNHLILTLV